MITPPTPALTQSSTISSTASRAAVITAQSGTSGSAPTDGIAGQIADLFVARVHRIGAAGKILLVQQHAFAERTGARRGTDHRDALRMQQAAQFCMAIDGGALRRHGPARLTFPGAPAYSRVTHPAKNSRKCPCRRCST